MSRTRRGSREGTGKVGVRGLGAEAGSEVWTGSPVGLRSGGAVGWRGSPSEGFGRPAEYRRTAVGVLRTAGGPHRMRGQRGWACPAGAHENGCESTLCSVLIFWMSEGAHPERARDRKAHPMRGWRNRQTRWIQVPVPERAWGFNSPLAHKSEAPQISDLRGFRVFRTRVVLCGSWLGRVRVLSAGPECGSRLRRVRPVRP